MPSLINLLKKDKKLFCQFMAFVGERQNAILLFLFSIWLVVPLHKSLQEMNILSGYLTDTQVAQMFMFIATIHAGSILIDNRIDRKGIFRSLRYLLVFLETLIWVALGTMSLLAFPPSFNWIGYFWFVFGSVQSFNNLEPDLCNLYESSV